MRERDVVFIVLCITALFCAAVGFWGGTRVVNEIEEGQADSLRTVISELQSENEELRNMLLIATWDERHFDSILDTMQTRWRSVDDERNDSTMAPGSIDWDMLLIYRANGETVYVAP